MFARCIWLPLILAALAAGSSADAQISEKQALKQFTSASKSVLSGYKGLLAGERALLDVDLDAIDAQIRLAALGSSQVAIALHGALSESQVALRGLAGNAHFDLYGAARDTLTALAGGVPLAGVFPRGFYAGDGGTMDLQVARLLTEWDRYYASVNTRLAKTRKLAETQDIGLTVVFRRPLIAIAGRWAEDGVLVSVGTRPLSVDTVVAASDLGLAGDGLIAVGGIGDNVFGDVTVDLGRPPGGFALNEVVAPAPTTDRWYTDTLAGFDHGPVVEGSYFFAASQQSGPRVEASIGVR